VKVDIKAGRIGDVMSSPAITVNEYGEGDPVPRSRIRILFLAANPIDTTRLAIDREAREIEQQLQLAKHREAMSFRSAWAVRLRDLSQLLNQHRPTIVHFSGHGVSSGVLLLENAFGEVDEISPASFDALFAAMKDRIRVVLLNACHSRAQAEAINRHIDFVVGMSTSIDDRAAAEFSSAFYRAVGLGCSVEQAFQQGHAALKLHHGSAAHLPALLIRPGADASQPL
jgi:CHAT domain-containing protein